MRRIERQILQNLAKGEIGVYRIIDLQDASLSEFFQLLRRLKKKSIIAIKDGKIELTSHGKNIVERMRCLPFADFTCDRCAGTGYEIKGPFLEITERFKTIAAERPPAKEEFDQGFMSQESVIRKISFIYERGDLGGSIFVLGDDDLVSIALAMTGIPERIFVVDIDPELINFIDCVSKTYGFGIETMIYDVQSELPSSIRGEFDIFISDPVETVEGFKLFLSRAATALRGKGSAGYFGLTTLEASRKKWYTIQRLIHRANFVITDIRRKHTIYPEEEKNFFRFQEKLPIVKHLKTKSNFDWYKSSLIRIEAIKKPKPFVDGPCNIGQKIYRDRESWATPQ